MSQTLFSIYINDIPVKNEKYANSCLIADDLSTFFSIRKVYQKQVEQVSCRIGKMAEAVASDESTKAIEKLKT